MSITGDYYCDELIVQHSDRPYVLARINKRFHNNCSRLHPNKYAFVYQKLGDEVRDHFHKHGDFNDMNYHQLYMFLDRLITWINTDFPTPHRRRLYWRKYGMPKYLPEYLRWDYPIDGMSSFILNGRKYILYWLYLKGYNLDQRVFDDRNVISDYSSALRWTCDLFGVYPTQAQIDELYIRSNVYTKYIDDGFYPSDEAIIGNISKPNGNLVHLGKSKFKPSSPLIRFLIEENHFHQLRLITRQGMKLNTEHVKLMREHQRDSMINWVKKINPSLVN